MSNADTLVKKKRIRCFHCKKKQLIVHKCICNKMFCLTHKYPDTHNCPCEKTYIHQKEIDLPCVPPKIQKI